METKHPGLISVTLDAKVYEKYKKAYDSIQEKMHPVAFVGDSRYEWWYMDDDEFIAQTQRDLDLMLSHAGDVERSNLRELQYQLRDKYTRLIRACDAFVDKPNKGNMTELRYAAKDLKEGRGY